MSGRKWLITAAALWCASASLALGQQINIDTPFNNSNDSFFENIGTNWGFNLGNAQPGNGSSSALNFSFGGQAPPQFGNFDPTSGANFGFASRGNNGSLFFNAFAGQGASRSNVSQTPTVTIPNGGAGYFIDGTSVPFVVGVVPVVGAYNTGPNYSALPPAAPRSVLQDRLERYYQERQLQQAAGAAANGRPREARPPADDAPLNLGGRSTAQRGDLSVAEIRQQRAQQTAQQSQQGESELSQLIERARAAEEAGKASVARIYYRQAALQAEGALKTQLMAKADALRK